MSGCTKYWRQAVIHPWEILSLLCINAGVKIVPGYRRKEPWTPGVGTQACITTTGTGLEFLKNTETRNTVGSSDTTSEESRHKHTTGAPAGWGLARCESQSPGYRTGLRAVHSGTGKENVMHIYTSVYAPTIAWLCHRAERGRATRRRVDGSTEHGLQEK